MVSFNYWHVKEMEKRGPIINYILNVIKSRQRCQKSSNWICLYGFLNSRGLLDGAIVFN